jgi:hypothetical protein
MDGQKFSSPVLAAVRGTAGKGRTCNSYCAFFLFTYVENWLEKCGENKACVSLKILFESFYASINI